MLPHCVFFLCPHISHLQAFWQLKHHQVKVHAVIFLQAVVSNTSGWECCNVGWATPGPKAQVEAISLGIRRHALVCLVQKSALACKNSSLFTRPLHGTHFVEECTPIQKLRTHSEHYTSMWNYVNIWYGEWRGHHGSVCVSVSIWRPCMVSKAFVTRATAHLGNCTHNLRKPNLKIWEGGGGDSAQKKNY